MIPEISYSFSEPIWLYSNNGTWHFVTLPKTIAKQIKTNITGPRRGWGSVRVAVCIGDTKWKTSIFPYQEMQSFILPIKASVRKAEEITEGDRPEITITALE
jgi:hypothetical protein